MGEPTLLLLVRHGIFTLFTSTHEEEWRKDEVVLRERHQAIVVENAPNPWESLLWQWNSVPERPKDKGVAGARNRFLIAIKGHAVSAKADEIGTDELCKVSACHIDVSYFNT